MKTQVGIAAQGRMAMDDTRTPSHLRTVTDSAQTLARRRKIPCADFASIYDLYRRKVYLWCLRLARNPEDAEDLAQDAFLLLYRKIDTFRGESAFSTWLYRLTTNTALMRLRRRQAPLSSLDEILENHEGVSKPCQELKRFEQSMTSSLVRVDLDRAFKQMPPGYQTAFFLHDYEDNSHEEIADLTGWSVGTSKSQLHKARRRLRELLRYEQGKAVRPSMRHRVRAGKEQSTHESKPQVINLLRQ